MTTTRRAPTASMMGIVKNLRDIARPLERAATVQSKARLLVERLVTKDADGKHVIKKDYDTAALVDGILFLAKEGDADIPLDDTVMLHCALCEKSMERWKDLWQAKHPDRPDEYKDGEDEDLMRVWRECLRQLFAEYGQGWVFDMKPKEYFKHFIAKGAKEDAVELLATHIYA